MVSSIARKGNGMGTHDLRLRLAQRAAQEGRTHEAAHLYAQVLQGNPYLPEAWWGLSQVVDDPAREVYCLQRVISLSPNFAEAQERLLSVVAHTAPATQ